MVYYIDSSALLRWLFKSEGYFSSFNQWSKSISSVLLEIEIYRTLQRLRLEGLLNDENLASSISQVENIFMSIQIIAIDEQIINLAKKPFSTVIKSLDAIHLSTAQLWRAEYQDDITILSHDVKFKLAAQSLGFQIYT